MYVYELSRAFRVCKILTLKLCHGCANIPPSQGQPHDLRDEPHDHGAEHKRSCGGSFGCRCPGAAPGSGCVFAGTPISQLKSCPRANQPKPQQEDPPGSRSWRQRAGAAQRLRRPRRAWGRAQRHQGRRRGVDFAACSRCSTRDPF